MPSDLPDPAKAEVFICYRRNPANTIAALLNRHLLEHNLDVFWDQKKISGGDIWQNAIDTALAGQNLAVGIVLMTRTWFLDMAARAEKADGDQDVVRREVEKMLDRALPHEGPSTLTVIPVYVDDPAVVMALGDQELDTDGPLPPRPSGNVDVAGIHDRLARLNVVRVPPHGEHGMDDLAGLVAMKVQAASLDRIVFDGRTAKTAPPLPVHVVGRQQEIKLRRSLRHYADVFGASEEDPHPQVLAGQDAVLALDFPRALDHLKRAIDHGRFRGPAGDDLWHCHALNLFALASFRGERPRRRQVSEATALFRDVLLPAIEKEAAWPWPQVPAAALPLEWRSRAYVTELTIGLLWLLWEDFFMNKNVRPPDLGGGRLDAVLRRLNALDDQLGYIEGRGAGQAKQATWGREELAFVVERYAAGLPDHLKRRARSEMVDGLTGRADDPAELVR